MSLPQRVTKTHATGNDFVVYLDKSGKFEPTADEVRFLCDRHFGIGGDGLIRLTRPDFVSECGWIVGGDVRQRYTRHHLVRSA